MRIERLHIQAYRSLYDVSVSPGPLTVIAGANNAGKSNFSDALNFLAEAYGLGVEHAVSRNGGMENIAFRRMRRTRQAIRFRLKLRAPIDEFRYLARERLALDPHASRRRALREEQPNLELALDHRFEIAATSRTIETGFAITDESLVLSASVEGRRDAVLLRLTRAGKSLQSYVSRSRVMRDTVGDFAVVPFNDKGYLSYLRGSVSSTDLVMTFATFNAPIRDFQSFITSTHLYQFSPLEARRSGASAPNPTLGRHGAELPALVSFMKRHHPRPWARTLQAMREIMPGLRDIEAIVGPDRLLTLHFLESGVGRPWNAHEVSDGTVKTLALFTALNDPRTRTIVVEEPENSVHPWIVRTFVEAARDVPDKQIILTTHSPALLSCVRPSEVMLAWRAKGRTHLRPLTEVEPAAEALWNEGKGTVFDLLDGGLVREAVPESLR